MPHLLILMIQMLLVNTTLADHSMKKMESETTESFVVSFEVTRSPSSPSVVNGSNELSTVSVVTVDRASVSLYPDPAVVVVVVVFN